MKLDRLLRSALRLPRRLAHVLRVALDVAGWTLTFQLRAGLRRRRHVRLLRRSALFDVPYYLARCGDDPAARKDPYTHYLLRGAARGLSPSPLFDGAAYLARTPGAAGQNPLVHHLLATRVRPAAPAPGRPAPGPGEELLLARPFRPAPPGARRVLVVDLEAPAEGGGASARAVELVRLAHGIGPVTLVSPRATPNGAEVLGGFAAALEHLSREGERYTVVVVRGVEQASRYLAPVRAYAAHATLVCDAAGSVPHPAGSQARSPARRERAAAVVLACCDVVLVDSPAEREAVSRLAPGARVEVVPRAEAGLEAIVDGRRSADAARRAGGAA